MKHGKIVVLVAGLAIVGMFGAGTSADDRDENARTLKATLKGIEESPSISSTGHGTRRAGRPYASSSSSWGSKSRVRARATAAVRPETPSLW